MPFLISKTQTSCPVMIPTSQTLGNRPQRTDVKLTNSLYPLDSQQAATHCKADLHIAGVRSQVTPSHHTSPQHPVLSISRMLPGILSTKAYQRLEAWERLPTVRISSYWKLRSRQALMKVNKYLPLDTASYTERLGIPSTLVWEPQKPHPFYAAH